MQWPKRRKSLAADAAPADEKKPPLSPLIEQKVKRLAQRLDQLPAKDEVRLREARNLELNQDKGSLEIYEICRSLVEHLNLALEKLTLDLTPHQYNPDSIDTSTGMLIQINAAGRIVQLAVQPREPRMCTDHFRIPYILRGSLRWFNQELLERQEIQENPIFYCTDRTEFCWRYVDPRTRKVGLLDHEYLMDTLDQLL